VEELKTDPATMQVFDSPLILRSISLA